MKYRCTRVRRELTAWLDLTEPERARLREHARDCAGCHAELEDTLELLGHLEAGREAYAKVRYTGPTPNLRTQHPLSPAKAPHRGFWRPVPVALAAGLFAATLATYLLINSQPPAPTLPPDPTPPPSVRVESPPESPSGPPRIRPASASASLEALRRQAGRLRKPATPKRPSGLRLHLPSRPTPPKQDAGRAPE